MNMADNSNNIAWPAALSFGTVFGSLALACIFPFAAFAALAALTMKPRAGIALIAAVWAVNQATGFFLLSFPWDGQAIGHGIAILAATLLGFGAAKFLVSKLQTGVVGRSLAALASAFAIYQIALRAYASVGGGAENFSAEIISAVALNDALWFAGLMALNILLARLPRSKAAQLSA